MSSKTALLPNSTTLIPVKTSTAATSALLAKYGAGSIPLIGTENAFYERHLLYDRAIDPQVASGRERFEAFSRSVRDILAQRWVQTKTTYEIGRAHV